MTDKNIGKKILSGFNTAFKLIEVLAMEQDVARNIDLNGVINDFAL